MASEFRGIEVFGGQPSTTRRRRKKSRRRAPDEPGHARLGIVALAGAVLTILGTWLGIVASMAGNFTGGTFLAYLATAASVLAVLAGVVSVVLGRGRTWGAIAIVLAVIASPPLLTRLLDWASGLG